MLTLTLEQWYQGLQDVFDAQLLIMLYNSWTSRG
jgi:hypothetical protein